MKSLLELLQYVHVCLLLRPQDWTVLQVWPQQWWVEQKDHFPWPDGSTSPKAVQDPFSLPCYSGMSLAYVPFCTYQDPRCTAKVLIYWVSPSTYWWMGLFLPWFRTCPFSCWTSLSFLLTCSCHGPSGWQHDSLVYQPLHLAPTFVSSANLQRAHSAPSSGMLMEILNRIRPSPDPWGTLLVPGLWLDCASDVQTVFSVPHCVCQSRPCFTGFSVSFLGETVSKASQQSR